MSNRLLLAMLFAAILQADGSRVCGQSSGLLVNWEQPASDIQLSGFNHPAADPSVIARLERLEAERFAAQQPIEQTPPAACCGSCRGCSCAACGCFRFYAGGELTLSKPRFEDGAEEDATGAPLDFALETAPRVWVGFRDPGGWGVRARYWTYDNTSSISGVQHVVLAGVRDQMSVEVGAFDIEGSQVTDFRLWRMDVAAGIRYGWFEQGVVDVDGGDYVHKRFHGIGPIISADFRRPLGFWGLAWIANLRGSLLVGESTWRSPTAWQKTDDLGAVAELQVGAEWRRKIRDWELFTHAVYEQQTWFGAGTYFGEPAGPGQFNQRLRTNDHDAALMGFAFALGVLW